MLTLETLAAPPANYSVQDFTDAMQLPKTELVDMIAATVQLERGEKTLLRRKAKKDLAELIARAVAYIKAEMSGPRKGPRPRKAVETRAERKARGTRKFRRDCMSARKHRAMVGNKHHKVSGR